METDRQTDMTKLIVTFRNFAKAPSKERPQIRKDGSQDKVVLDRLRATE